MKCFGSAKLSFIIKHRELYKLFKAGTADFHSRYYFFQTSFSSSNARRIYKGGAAGLKTHRKKFAWVCGIFFSQIQTFPVMMFRICRSYRESKTNSLNITLVSWGVQIPQRGSIFSKGSGARFSNVPKLFGWNKSRYIFNKNIFQALKLGSYFAFPCIWNISKEQVFTASGP